MAIATERNWDKVWVVTYDGRKAWKCTDPGHTVYLGCDGELSADVWMDRMEEKGFDIIDGRGQPAGNVWN